MNHYHYLLIGLAVLVPVPEMLGATIDELKSELATLKNDYTSDVSKLKDELQRIATLENELATFKKDYESLEAYANKQESIAQGLKNQLAANKEELKKQITDEELDRLHKAVEGKNRELTELKSKYDEILARYAQEAQESCVLAQDKIAIIQDGNKRCNALIEEKAAVSREKNELERRHNQVQRELTALTDTHKDIKEKYESIRDAYDVSYAPGTFKVAVFAALVGSTTLTTLLILGYQRYLARAYSTSYKPKPVKYA